MPLNFRTPKGGFFFGYLYPLYNNDRYAFASHADRMMVMIRSRHLWLKDLGTDTF